MNDILQKPMDHGRMSSILQKLSGPQLRTVHIGASAMGRPIPAAVLGGGEEAVLFAGGIHGSEWITSAVLLQFLADVVDCLHSARRFAGYSLRALVTKRKLYVVPMLNPDGVELAVHGLRRDDPAYARLRFYNDGSEDFSHWQSNSRGVDLNHNFDAGFAAGKALEQQNGVYGPGPTRFGGRYPFSEPETAALRDFAQSRDLAALFAFHSQGEEIYCDYNGHAPGRALETARILAKVSGYTVGKTTGIASVRGMKDWFIEKYDRPGFTVEIGRGENPLPVEQFPAVYRKLRELLILAATL